MAKFSVGQKVLLANEGYICPTYYTWATDNNLPMSDKIRKLWAKYLSSNCNDCEEGRELTVVACGHHGIYEAIMYLCEDSYGDPVLVEEKGLKSTKEGLKWSDLKLFDKVHNKLTDETAIVIGIKPEAQSVCIAEHYTNDLEDWEKVE